MKGKFSMDKDGNIILITEKGAVKVMHYFIVNLLNKSYENKELHKKNGTMI